MGPADREEVVAEVDTADREDVVAKVETADREEVVAEVDTADREDVVAKVATADREEIVDGALVLGADGGQLRPSLSKCCQRCECLCRPLIV